MTKCQWCVEGARRAATVVEETLQVLGSELLATLRGRGWVGVIRVEGGPVGL